MTGGVPAEKAAGAPPAAVCALSRENAAAVGKSSFFVQGCSHGYVKIL